VTSSLYIASAEADSGKSAIALGVLDDLLRVNASIAVFRPVVRNTDQPDPLVELLRSRGGPDLPPEASVGVSYEDVNADPDAAVAAILQRFRALAARVDGVLVVGSDFTEVGAPTELAFNARVATNLGAPVMFVVAGQRRSAAQIRQSIDVAAASIAAQHARLIHVVANRVDPDIVEEVRKACADVQVPFDVVPEVPELTSPSVGQLMASVDGRLVAGDPELLSRDVLDIVVAAMTLPNMLTHLTEGAVVITPGDRSDIVMGTLLAHRTEAFPRMSGMILSGGLEPSEELKRLLLSRQMTLPMIVTDLDTFDTAHALADTRGRIDPQSATKVDRAIDTVASNVDLQRVRGVADVPESDVVTPLMFEYTLMEQARAHRRHVVLPEGNEPRILKAASIVLRRGIADLTLLGNEEEIRQLATDLGVDIDGAAILDPNDEGLRDRFAAEYARLRAHKGVTMDAARDTVVDVSYFGTMMVHLGLADGMVSGAVHTTAHTIRPSFEIIKTKPGVSVVSSVFLMCLADRVLVYGDCAVNPTPNPEQLADIAISSAETAQQFGVQPKVAMLSYSTGTSGSGADVEKVRSATTMVKERAPQLSVEGPIQYDAAVDASVAATKLPESDVAGQAKVFIFPDLNTGNNTYKAVQRSAGAVAIGPVLQGLNKPVNDLSRGALVEDIVNTIAITAVQAQEQSEDKA
jgi:phosphate acetyltransferase